GRVSHGQGTRQVQAGRAPRGSCRFPGVIIRQGVEEGARRNGDPEAGAGKSGVRIIDLHCYPGTKEWIASQGPYVDALAKYWSRGWTAKTEEEVLKDFSATSSASTPASRRCWWRSIWKRRS